jgi:hypothetical protein
VDFQGTTLVAEILAPDPLGPLLVLNANPLNANPLNANPQGGYEGPLAVVVLPGVMVTTPAGEGRLPRWVQLGGLAGDAHRRLELRCTSKPKATVRYDRRKIRTPTGMW